MEDGEDGGEKKIEQGLRQRKMTAPRRLWKCSEQSRNKPLSRVYSDINFHFRSLGIGKDGLQYQGVCLCVCV